MGKMVKNFERFTLFNSSAPGDKTGQSSVPIKLSWT